MMLARNLLLLGLLLVATGAGAERYRVESPDYRVPVVELYTSEGCSSCPPADAWVGQLVRVPKDELDALVLALHVDYWDYLGWKDRYANPEHTRRQRRLARSNRQNSIYTPEFLVDGRETRGTHRIIQRIKAANREAAPLRLMLDIDRGDRSLQLSLNSPQAQGKRWKARFIVYEDGLATEVERGENAGRRLTHERVVRHFGPALPLAGGLTRTIELLPEWRRDKLGIGVIVEDEAGRPLQALNFRFPS